MTVVANGTPEPRRASRLRAPALQRVLRVALPVLVVAYGALLRFDAISLRYGSVDRPAWLHALQESRDRHSILRPDAITWEREGLHPHRGARPTQYLGDPYTYLQYAREMRSFYAAHRREPVFPYVTKIFLGLLGGKDVAVSFASAFFSVLAIVATYLLGAYAFSRRVGLAAALGMAIEYDVVTAGAAGGRDDAFTFAVVLSAYVMLRYARVPSRGHAILVGALTALACLIRITALSFLVPAFAWLLVGLKLPWRQRAAGVGLAALTAAVLVAPFAINSWLTFGDPLHSINVHADVYRAAEGQTVEHSQTAMEYLASEARTRPLRTLDTAALGMTSYPFLNKWRGFDPWLAPAGRWLSWAALAGLFLFAGSPSGRLMLLVLAASLLPYAATWRLIGDWRFTEHAYPFFLIAAAFAVAQVVTLAAPSRLAALRRWRPAPRPLLLWGAALLTVACGVWITTRTLPALAIEETLRANEDVTIAAGDRDGAFFTEGWSAPMTEGAVTSRASEDQHSVVRLPLPKAGDYDLTVRLDPFPRPGPGTPAELPIVRVFLNDRPAATLRLAWNPERVGSYAVHVPAGTVRPGWNRLSLVADAKDGVSPRFRLWYVRVRPPGS